MNTFSQWKTECLNMIYVAFDQLECFFTVCSLQPGVKIQHLPPALAASYTFLRVHSNGQCTPCISEADSTARVGVLEDKGWSSELSLPTRWVRGCNGLILKMCTFNVASHRSHKRVLSQHQQCGYIQEQPFSMPSPKQDKKVPSPIYLEIIWKKTLWQSPNTLKSLNQ